MTRTKTRIEIGVRPPWYVTLGAKTAIPFGFFMGTWAALWAFGGLSAYLNPRFSPAFVTFLSLGWVPVALANFVLLHFVGRFHMRMMDKAAEALHQHTHDVMRQIDNDMREKLELPPAAGPTLQ